MVDIEEISLEPVSLGDGARLRHHRGRVAVAAFGVMPERKMRAPLDLHQRADFRSPEDGRGALDERCSGLALRLPIDVSEQRRRGQHAQVEVAFTVDELIQALCATVDVLVFRSAEQECNQPGRACPQLAFMVENFRPHTTQQSFELGQPILQRRESRPLVVVTRHHRAERQRLASQIAGSAERFVCTLDRRSTSLRLDEDPRSTEPVSQPRIALAHVRRQRFDPVGQRLRTALTCPFERVRANE